MACKVEACPECTKKCLPVHGKKKNLSPLVTTFFKVMIGDRFSQVLYLPPKFVATVSSLENQKTFLDDSSGQQWGVTISNLNGSLAFEQGWSSFSSDHGLQVGDFLIFSYIMGSHFDVKVFDTTGCEKIDFPENSNAKERARVNWNCTAKHGKHYTIGECSTSKYSGASYQQSRGAMACMVEDCPECTKKCLPVHGKKKNLSPLVTTFFKVMIGDRFSQVLKTFLDDSSGQQWGVTISNLNGSLAFEQGWSSFSSDHGLQVGDFLIFSYIMGSHFDVKVFDTTGCEKIDFPENSNAKKRARVNWNCTAKHDKHYTIGECSTSKYSSRSSIGSVSDVEISQSQCEGNDVELILKAPENILNGEKSKERAKPVSNAEYIEEPYYIIDRDVRDKQGNERSDVLDLFNLETIDYVMNKAAVEDARFPSHTDTPVRSQIETCVVVKDPVNKEVMSRVAPKDVSDFEMIEKSHYYKAIDKKASTSDKISCDDKTSWHPLTKSFVRLEENEENMSKISNRGITRCPIAKGSIAAASRNESKLIKEEEHNQSSDTIVREKVIVPGVVKVESIDAVGISSPIRVVATESQSFLVLPSCLSSYQVRPKMQSKVVLLRDPAMRLWPVLYHEKYCLICLTNCWEAFSKANGIQPGDECVFGVESDSEGIYSVLIARRW